MYAQANIYRWILRKSWKGFDNLEDIVSAYFPLYRSKYLHPFEKTSEKSILLEMRKNARFNIPGISLTIETPHGMKKFRLLDISENGLSFMIRGEIDFFQKFHKHNIMISVGGQSVYLRASYRHMTLIHAKKIYHKYGVEFLDGDKKLQKLIDTFVK